jgi:hypothetical protein
MQDHTEFMPDFLLNLRLDEGPNPYVVSCSIVGQVVGFRGVVRRFADRSELMSQLNDAGILSDRYNDPLAHIEAEPGQAKSFALDLNEAQRLSIIQTDTTE